MKHSIHQLVKERIVQEIKTMEKVINSTIKEELQRIFLCADFQNVIDQIYEEIHDFLESTKDDYNEACVDVNDKQELCLKILTPTKYEAIILKIHHMIAGAEEDEKIIINKMLALIMHDIDYARKRRRRDLIMEAMQQICLTNDLKWTST